MHQMLSENRIENVVHTFQDCGLTIPSLINGLLDNDSPAQQSLAVDAVEFCSIIHTKNPEAVFSWAFELVRKKMCSEVEELSRFTSAARTPFQ
ncbi:hypothetical protein BDZ97DRAFT_1865753, partial [Flammula alnicola]